MPYTPAPQPRLPALLLGLSLLLPGFTQADSGLLIIDDDEEEALVIDSEDSGGLQIDDDTDSLIISDEPAPDSTREQVQNFPREPRSNLDLSLERLQLEYGQFDSSSDADYQAWGHARVKLNWQQGPWELQASARLDSYAEHPDDDSAADERGDWHETELDYGDSYLRYKGRRGTLTLGAQTVIWGRIDEFPPTDRLSTQDLRRGLLDDLEDRRLASAALRYEHFIGSGKLDFLYLPRFREAELPGKDSVWYPINQRRGTIIGLDTTPLAEAIVRATPISEKAPDGEGGMGLRFSQLGAGFDYALAVQRGYATLPYFAYDPARNLIASRYLRSTTVSGDIGFEALGGTLKLEAAWNSDTPVTRTDGRFDSVESVTWGAALELFPGDGDTRLNLQLTGQYLLDAPPVMDRDKLVSVNGSLEWPFADNNWRARTRFNIGLDMDDLYVNPELTYSGFNNQEIYLEAHIFDGDKGSVGGFYEDNSLISLGWRANL